MNQVRSCLSLDSSKNMVHAFITSCLDYCNSLLCGLPKNQIKKLQAIQNTAACLVTNSYKYDDITHILKDLHWLTVQQRINSNILLFIFKYLHGQAPKYLQEFLIWYQPKGLRSDNKLLLLNGLSTTTWWLNHSFKCILSFYQFYLF